MKRNPHSNTLGQRVPADIAKSLQKQQALSYFKTQSGAQTLQSQPDATWLTTSGPKAPQKTFERQDSPLNATRNNPTLDRPSEFVFEHDFDENGALYYLGSFAKKRLWQNPHQIGQILAFGSSVGGGKIEDFVGRTATNCRTLNEPYSYFGVDLGNGRRLLPTCYSIRNRNSPTHVLLNWHFEGSNDKVNWTLLDRRIYFTNSE